MLRTNTKAAKENVMNYVIANSAEYLQECGYIEENASVKEICAGILEAFHSEYYKGYIAKLPHYEAFKQWASGLACGSLFNYYLHSAVNDVAQILEETEEEAARYTEIEAENLLTWLIYREVKKKAGK